MAEKPRTEDLTYRNVELHSLGRKEYGTLVLTRHHFVFRYYPGAKPGADNSIRPQDVGPKQRQREMWMPYPLVHRCVLRPSHSFAPSMRFEASEAVSEYDEQDEDSLFPPTYGTSEYGRPSTDSSHLAPYSSPARIQSPAASISDGSALFETGRQPAIRIRLKDFRMLALHFHTTSSSTSADDIAREVFYALRSRCCIDNIRDLHAFHFTQPKEESAALNIKYDARREYARMGIGGKAASGPGAAWRISDINHDYSYSATYPNVLCVPAIVSDNLLKYGGVFRSRSRIPCLSYLHPNGGSITRSSQPMVGVQSKRNPQDERLVSAIFSSHTPVIHVPKLDDTANVNNGSAEREVPDLPISQSESGLDEVSDEKPTPGQPKVYGSTRRNLIVDARPKINALANRATGGGIEDVANYRGNADMPVERVFLNVANIHVMRASLDKVVDSFANSDYIKMKPDQEALRKSGWLGHIAGMLDGAEMIARVIGLGGSHVLIHCSDGWDRTAQMSALVQVMLDPYSRTLNGFITLIQKDFLSFGHKFRDRDGIEGSEKWFEIENERVAPSRNRDSTGADPNTLNALGSKALSGAKNWFEKNRGSIFRQQNNSRDNVSEQGSSRPPSPPPNPLLHSSPSMNSKEDRPHRMSEKEVSPIFHQFLDTVYQLLHQNPTAFEFNEHFLCRLFYHVYSCQYGEFLFNNEKERNQYTSQVGSVWSHFLSRKQEFINPAFAPNTDDTLIFPRRSGPDREVDVRWWNRLFRREDGEMNVPRALLRNEGSGNTFDSSARGSLDGREAMVSASVGASPAPNGGVKKAQSNPVVVNTNHDHGVTDGLASLNLVEPKEDGEITNSAPRASSPTPIRSKAAVEQHESEDAGSSHGIHDASAEDVKIQQPAAVEYEGDPLGVMAASPSSKKAERSGLDFAAFASQNAFRDR